MSSLFSKGKLCSNCARRWTPASLRWASTYDTPPPPLLSKIRNDLKSAMKAKDTARLNVLRSIITETGNASKGPNPVSSDLQILAMLRKRKSASQAAAEEARQAKREDLAEKQVAEMSILDEYASHVKVMSEEDTRQVVQSALETIKIEGTKISQGVIMKQLLKNGGPLEGKSVDKALLATVVKDLVQEQVAEV